MSGIVDKFGKAVYSLLQKDPEKARCLLSLGFRAKRLEYMYFPGKMNKASRMAASCTSKSMINALTHPGDSAIVSLFTPSEILHSVGITPYSCEGLGCFLSGAFLERPFLEYAEREGISDTFCSYHKTFIGAAEEKHLPKPLFIISTSLACDANALTFRRLSNHFDVPHFVIDVPYEISEDSVSFVESEMRMMKKFVEENTKRKVDDELLSQILARSQRSMDYYERYLTLSKGKSIMRDLNDGMFACFMLHNLLGTRESEEYARKCVDVAGKASPSSAVNLLWIHSTPFWMENVRAITDFNENVAVVGCDMAYEGLLKADCSNPYRAMAERLVYSAFNGPVMRRIERGINEARRLGADGAVWFCHWGCKHTLGGATLAKRKFEEAGIPLLILPGDGCDRRHGGYGQVETRLGAFVEMLSERRGS